MSGCVWQLCSDSYDEDFYKKKSSSSTLNPYSDNGAYRVIRGGNYLCEDEYCSCSRRWFTDDEDFLGSKYIGFRLVLDINPIGIPIKYLL